jgi:hypothetical protein
MEPRWRSRNASPRRKAGKAMRRCISDDDGTVIEEPCQRWGCPEVRAIAKVVVVMNRIGTRNVLTVWM